MVSSNIVYRCKLVSQAITLLRHQPLISNSAREHSAQVNVSAAAIPQIKGRRLVTLIPGDGVGPELAYSVQEVFKNCGIPVDFTEIFVSEIHHSRSASLDDVIARIKSTGGVALKGSIQTGSSSHTGELQSLNMRLKRSLDLFASLVHIKSMKGIKTKHENLDFVIIREQTEGEYSSLEHESVPGIVESLKITTREKCLRIAKFAFDYATKHNRKRITAVHKANIMKLGDGLFLKCCDDVSKLYPKLKFDNLIIDNCCMQMVSKPQQFDLCVMPNLYGNIVDNLAAGLVGGAGVVTGESYGSECVVFEPGARHSFHEAMGRDIANPTATLLCAANMLQHLHLNPHSEALRRAVEKVIAVGKVRTKDLGGYATTSEFTSAVIDNFRM